TLIGAQARVAEDLAPAFDSFAKGQVQAIIITPNALFLSQRSRIIQLALSARLPTISFDGESVRLGGPASYGVDPRENFRRAAAHVDKIPKGAKPGDLPIEFATKLDLVINLKTANALGITVPATILGRSGERAAQIAAEFVRLNIDVIATSATVPTLAGSLHMLAAPLPYWRCAQFSQWEARSAWRLSHQSSDGPRISPL